ncbi:unnamed protein product [Spirodela intermedia]|uniref:Phosphatidic acid phosphatase type 2/haloperoxidase domain-containing protein n=1 Tax=Spirodela intermedia TaxID=51605 RepID=A0A7I8KVK3_SPIIN|nr:unnamed protein product [Spirodela intermedia]
MAAAAAAATSPLRRVVELDEAWSLRIHEACQVVPRRLLKALEISGDGRIWIPIPIALLLASPSPELYCVAMGLLAGFLLDLLFVGLLKHLVRRSRPLYNKGMYLTFAVDHWSFPSGHSSRVFFISTFLYLVRGSLREAAAGVVGPSPWPRWRTVLEDRGLELGHLFLPSVFLWSVVTSASRILLGRHFVVDVIAGGCLGLLEAAVVFLFLLHPTFFTKFLLDR